MTQQANLAFNFDAVYGNQTGSMFLNGGRGLIDSIHRVDTTTFDRYKILKAQDWDENEFTLQNARPDFITYPLEGEMMLNNIGWQWGGDSSAANSLIPMMAPFQPISDAWLWFVRQGDNENLHALTYSECTRVAVPDGMNEIRRIHNDNSTLQRLHIVTSVLDKVIRAGANITLGNIKYDSNEASDALMLGLSAIFILERCQFMPSFLNTAVLYFQNKFKPIGESVRKIAIDEYGTHIPQIRYMIENELKVPQRAESMRRIRPLVTALLNEVVSNEISWNVRQFRIGGEQLGMTEQMGSNYARYAGTDVAVVLDVTPDFDLVTRNPAPIMDNFLNLNRQSAASMEEKGGNYNTLAIAKSVIVDGDIDLDGV